MRTVAVIGSGAAGLSAALAAARAGAEVTVYERADKLGGTTALSGGVAWLPAHPGLDDDSPEMALRYMRALAVGDVDDGLVEVFVHEAGSTAARVERDTPLRLRPIPTATITPSSTVDASGAAARSSPHHSTVNPRSRR